MRQEDHELGDLNKWVLLLAAGENNTVSCPPPPAPHEEKEKGRLINHDWHNSRALWKEKEKKTGFYSLNKFLYSPIAFYWICIENIFIPPTRPPPPPLNLELELEEAEYLDINAV